MKRNQLWNVPVSRRQFGLLGGAGAALALQGCIATNKATGRTSFTGTYAPSDDVALGKQQHPRLLEQFGGEYSDRRLQGYVEQIGRNLSRFTEYRNDFPYTFTLLNSPIVNAFALPGGYVYVSRGLLALASNEAELAGVLAHELGHVNARHSAERISAQQASQIGAMLASIGLQVAGINPDYASLGQSIATVALQSYSRKQEFEADTLGVRYMSRAGYDPEGMVTFLATLRAQSVVEARAKGLPDGTVDQYNMMSTHPRTIDRVRAATSAARINRPANPIQRRREYLAQIDGIMFGDDPAQGVVAGQTFKHATLGFEFSVPDGFRMYNSPENVTAQNASGAAIIFDMGGVTRSRTLGEYVASEWVPDAGIQHVQPLEVNGFQAVAAHTRASINSRPMDARLVAIERDQGSVFRLLFLSPPATTAALQPAFDRTTFSFRRLSAAEAEAVKPLRLRVVQARGGESVEQLSKRLPYGPQNADWFRILNALEGQQQPAAKQLLKVVG